VVEDAGDGGALFFGFFCCGGGCVFIGGLRNVGGEMWWFCGFLMEKCVGSVVCEWLCFWEWVNRHFFEVFFGGRERNITATADAVRAFVRMNPCLRSETWRTWL
jgi:hypothetical protein